MKWADNTKTGHRAPKLHCSDDARCGLWLMAYGSAGVMAALLIYACGMALDQTL